MGGVQTIYMILGQTQHIPHVTVISLLESKGQPCALTKMGQLLYYGKVVITWRKDSPYGPLINY